MPRRSKGARLQLKAARRDDSGNITHRATWIIRDNGRDVSTGCAESKVAQAEQKLREYIASKYEPKKKAQDIEAIPVADALLIYLDAELSRLRDRFKVDEANEDSIADVRKFKMRIGRLNDWWGIKVLSDVDESNAVCMQDIAATKVARAAISRTCVQRSITISPKVITAVS